MQRGHARDHGAPREQLAAGEHDEHESHGEDEGAQELGDARRVLIVPRDRRHDERPAGRQGQQAPGRHGAEEGLVGAAAPLLGPETGYDLDGLGGRVGHVAGDVHHHGVRHGGCPWRVTSAPGLAWGKGGKGAGQQTGAGSCRPHLQAPKKEKG